MPLGAFDRPRNNNGNNNGNSAPQLGQSSNNNGNNNGSSAHKKTERAGTALQKRMCLWIKVVRGRGVTRYGLAAMGGGKGGECLLIRSKDRELAPARRPGDGHFYIQVFL